MSAFRFYTVLAAICGLVVWMISWLDPAERPRNATPNPAGYATPQEGGVEKIAQAFER